MEAGLYIHIPFCEKKCDYCDFYSITALDRIDSFISALQKEIEIRSPIFSDYTFHTIFFGGGTPSLLKEKQVLQIWDTLTSNLSFIEKPEITVEANPGTLTHSKLSFLKNIGFNRLSLGVQSFNPDELTFLGRIHSAEDVYENFSFAREAGFSNINIDLMTAFPGITLDSFKKSLGETIRLRPEHISCYTLIFEPGTVFHRKMLKGQLNPLEDAEEASYYRLASAILKENGYHHYEISNFSIGENNLCKHNLIYWNHKPYLGLGPSAHSFFNNQRHANKRSLSAYLDALDMGNLPIDFQENLSDDDLIFEYMILNLRLQKGINLSEFRNRFGVDCSERFNSKIKYLSENNLIEVDDRYLRLSEKGWMFADSIAAYF